MIAEDRGSWFWRWDAALYASSTAKMRVEGTLWRGRWRVQKWARCAQSKQGNGSRKLIKNASGTSRILGYLPNARNERTLELKQNLAFLFARNSLLHAVEQATQREPLVSAALFCIFSCWEEFSRSATRSQRMTLASLGDLCLRSPHSLTKFVGTPY